MDHVTPAPVEYAGRPLAGTGANEAHSSGVSWAAVIGGAFVAAALSVSLLALGAGLGLSTVSPWSQTGTSAQEMRTATIVWIIVMQIAACGMGGYLAGRLRTKWVNVHTDEVFFRDTAHGFLVWAVALVISASFLASAAGSIMGGAVRAATAGLAAGGTVAATASATGNRGEVRNPNATAYYVDSLFRTDTSATGTQGAMPANDPAAKAEMGRIFSLGLEQTEFPAADKSYIARRVAAQTGLSQADAEKRVTDTITAAKQTEASVKQAADEARKDAAHGLLWIFLSILIGAFCASFAATIGGRQRDRMVAVATN